jgi:hypothetical protein
MTDKELVERLREGATWDDDVAAADRIEQLVAINEALTVEREFFEEEWVSAVDKLNKAVEALRYYAVEAMPWEADDSLIARATLAEIEGLGVKQTG